jgi:hypothetical protein
VQPFPPGEAQWTWATVVLAHWLPGTPIALVRRSRRYCAQRRRVVHAGRETACPRVGGGGDQRRRPRRWIISLRALFRAAGEARR